MLVYKPAYPGLAVRHAEHWDWSKVGVLLYQPKILRLSNELPPSRLRPAYELPKMFQGSTEVASRSGT